MMPVFAYCRHCGQQITVATEPINRGVWVHVDSKSRYCDLSVTTFAVPR